MNNRMLVLYGLKWNPFAVNVPTEALHVTPRLELFCWRVQQLTGDGGFALITGAPGCGKSATLRIRRVAGHAARRHRRCDQPPTGQHRRLLPLMPGARH